MKISKKLLIMGCCSVAALLALGGLGFYLTETLGGALSYTTKNVLPSLETIYRLKTNQQQVAMNVYRHILADEPKEFDEAEKGIAVAQKAMRDEFVRYEPLISSARDKELYEAEKSTAEEYFRLLPSLLEKSRGLDKEAAQTQAAAMAAVRMKLANVIDEHIGETETQSRSMEVHAVKAANRGRMLTLAITLFASIVVGTVSFVVVRGINRSLSEIQGAIERIEGQLDFTVQAEVIGKDEISDVSSALNRLLAKLRSSLSSVTMSSAKLSEAAAQLALASDQVASASAHQSDAASGMAASVEEMTVSITHVSDRSNEAQTLSADSGKLAEEGKRVISQTVEDINQIAASVSEAAECIRQLEARSEQISSVVSVIKEVADQTNLLALNAAIEAARAGEQGRGFAVVADEVRKLAERTAGSTTEIAEMINAVKSVSKTAVDSMTHAEGLVKSGVERAGNASDAIQKIEAGSKQAVMMVEEIASAIREQSQASNTIASNVEGIAQMAEESSAAAKNSSEAAHNVDELAKEVRQVVGAYRV